MLGLFEAAATLGGFDDDMLDEEEREGLDRALSRLSREMIDEHFQGAFAIALEVGEGRLELRMHGR